MAIEIRVPVEIRKPLTCPIHGELENFPYLNFADPEGKETTFCLFCIRDLLLKHIQPLIRE